MRPLNAQEGLRHFRASVRRVIDDDRNNEGLRARHEVRTLVGKVPLQPEISLGTRFGVGRDQRKEQRAILDLLADLLIPGIAAAQFATVEPDFEPAARSASQMRRAASASCEA